MDVIPAKLVATANTAMDHPTLQVVDIGKRPSKGNKMDEFWIGRHQDADIVLIDATVSRKHACLKFIHNRWKVLDKGSSNGVKLNGIVIASGVFTQISEGDVLSVVNKDNNFEWKFHYVSPVSPKGAVKGKVELVAEIDQNLKDAYKKIVEKNKNLEQKVSEIQKEQLHLEAERLEMARRLAEEQKHIADKQEKERAQFEAKIKDTKEEIVQVQRQEFEELLIIEKRTADEQRIALEKELSKRVEDAETRIHKLRDEKDEIIISLELETAQNKDKMEEMKTNFDKQLKELQAGYQNEKASAEEQKMAIEALKNTFNDNLNKNQQVMEEAMTKMSEEKKKQEEEKDTMKQELMKKEAELAELKEQLKKEQDKGFLAKCNEELKCSVCDELYIEPMTLGCGHVYCRFCLEQWEMQCGNCFAEFNCPNCREPITTYNKSLQLDNLIKSMYQGLGEVSQREREALIEERKAEEEGVYKLHILLYFMLLFCYYYQLIYSYFLFYFLTAAKNGNRGAKRLSFI